MRSVAMQMLHDDDLAADAVQDTFVQLWRHRWRIGRLKDKHGFCIKALQNRCLDILRRQQRTLQHYSKIEYEYKSTIEETDNNLEERYLMLEKAIADLPPQQRQLVELKYLKQHSIREIAQLTNLSETNIRTILSRAYTTLRKALQQTDQDQ